MSWRQRVKALIGVYLTASSKTAVSSGPIQGNIGDVVWSSCPGNDTLPGAECGYAIVPLDYFNPSAGVAKIALARFNATANRKGSLIMNPGGPGGSGLRFAMQIGDVVHQQITEEYDIIGFDPRGIGQTEPATLCFPEPGSRMQFIKNTIIDRGYDVGPNLTEPSNRFHLIETQRDADALYKAQYAICAQTMGDQLRYMGTSTVARDIDFITTLLDGKDALINFYGLSYGSIMGQYLVNMFPNRVGRVAIDGVVDADTWTAVPPYKWARTYSTSTDSTYRKFTEDCAKAGPSQCPLSKSVDDTSDDVFNRIEGFINKLYTDPLPVPNATLPGILTHGRVRMFLIEALAGTHQWQALATALNNGVDGDGTMILDSWNQKPLVDLERPAVTCNDVKPFPPPKPEELVDEGLDVAQHISSFYFASTIAEPDLGCQFWPVTPPERFSGPWNHTLSNPILVISNTHDPATSLTGGQTVHKALGNSSALLIQDGPGHTSFALASLCTQNARRAFFANGTLPAEGTVCPVDEFPFPLGANSGSSGVSSLGSTGVKTLASADGDGVHDGVRRIAQFVNYHRVSL